MNIPTLDVWRGMSAEDKAALFLTLFREGVVSSADMYRLMRLVSFRDEVEFFDSILKELVEIEAGRGNPALLLQLLAYFKEVAMEEGIYFHTARVLNAARKCHKHARVSFSQEGEDLIIGKIFGNKPKGTYVDVGAYHPCQYSNTFSLYLSGWRGVNIEPNKENLHLFDRLRPEDVNLPYVVGNPGSHSVYYEFAEPAYNTFAKDRVDSLASQGISPLRSRTVLEKTALSTIIEDHLAGYDVDVLNVDVEGLEADVLQSADLATWRPRLILVEQLEHEISRILNSAIYRHLTCLGYELVAETFSTCFYKFKG